MLIFLWNYYRLKKFFTFIISFLIMVFIMNVIIDILLKLLKIGKIVIILKDAFISRLLKFALFSFLLNLCIFFIMIALFFMIFIYMSNNFLDVFESDQAFDTNIKVTNQAFITLFGLVVLNNRSNKGSALWVISNFCIAQPLFKFRWILMAYPLVSHFDGVSVKFMLMEIHLHGLFQFWAIFVLVLTKCTCSA
jgi:hypothetical protein